MLHPRPACVLLALLTATASLSGGCAGPSRDAEPAPTAAPEAARATLEETRWKLVRLDGQPVEMTGNQEREVFFRLRTDTSRVTGFAGCNTFSGPYELEEGDRVRFGPLAMTMKLCPDVDVDESELMEVFELTDNYRITGDRLDLNVGRRAPLATFEAVYLR